MSSRHTAALLAVLVAIAGVAPGVAAQESSIWDSFDAETDETSVLERVSIANAEIMATLDKLQYQAASITTDESGADRVDRYANDFTDAYAEHNETLEAYANSRFSGNASEYDVVALKFAANDETTTRYLVADANDSTGNFSNSEIVNTTDRPVDYTVGFEEYAAKNAASELEYFVTEYAAEDKDIDRALLTRMGKRYASDIDLPEEVQWP